ncbi:MAG: acyl-CoA dehydratase activase-related protein [Clostridia bacterium]
MKIGIAKGLSTYEFPILYKKFFEFLNIDVVESSETNNKIIEDGINNSIDESCLASKIYIGHIKELLNRQEKEKIDYIFVPRTMFLKNKETVCTKFYAMSDIVHNTFDIDVLTLNIDYEKGENEFLAYIRLGKRLGKNFKSIVIAYFKAKKLQDEYCMKKLNLQKEKLLLSDKINILIVSHPYIVYDKYMGKPVCSELERLGANIFYADVNSSNNKFGYKKISKTLYWKSSINLLNGVDEYLSQIDGIVYLSVFPCGLDSLVNESAIRKVKSVASINLIIDEQDAFVGIQTRLESFMDILIQNKELKKVSNYD